ncbi:MAG TPA: radical SAM protein [Thermomicrobiaceae bacterium]|nr:radical SAM protein [Thermomicrobiaceae bacterium]
MATELPSYVQIEPVGQCNLRCQMCAIQFRRDGPPWGPLAFMDFDDFTRVVDQFPALTELHLQGLGETMLYPRYFDMVRYAAGRGIRVSTNSNLTALSPRRAELAVRSGLDCLHVSLDGATAATYERIRVGARFDRVVRNVETLLAARARLGGDRPRIRLVSVVMRQNLHELPDLVRLAQRWGVEGHFVQHLCHDFGESSLPAHYRPMRDFVECQTLLNEDPVRVAHYFDAARAVAGELGVDLRLPRTRPRAHPPGTPGRQRCGWPWTGAYVSYQGYVMPCCMVSTPDRVNFGSLRDTAVEAIWDGTDFGEFRARLASDDPPEICRSCAIYTGTF